MTGGDSGVAVRGRRRGRQWTQVSHGLYRSGQCHELAAWRLVLPATGRFTHLTAAAVLGWWLPPLPHDLPVLAAVDRTSRRPAREGLRVLRTDPVLTPQERDGLRLDAPAEVLLACARDLGLLDLVMLLDSALRAGACSAVELAAVGGKRRKGGPLLRRALSVADPRAESPWESVLRQFHVVCDVPVEPQRELWTPEGTFIARADLWIPGTPSLHEYDGGVHLTRQQPTVRCGDRTTPPGCARGMRCWASRC